eukprot:5154279-Pyramimonas_sp.AAC.1
MRRSRGAALDAPTELSSFPKGQSLSDRRDLRRAGAGAGPNLDREDRSSRCAVAGAQASRAPDCICIEGGPPDAHGNM